MWSDRIDVLHLPVFANKIFFPAWSVTLLMPIWSRLSEEAMYNSGPLQSSGIKIGTLLPRFPLTTIRDWADINSLSRPERSLSTSGWISSVWWTASRKSSSLKPLRTIFLYIMIIINVSVDIHHFSRFVMSQISSQTVFVKRFEDSETLLFISLIYAN